ncbi:MAG: gliding motility-associated C-terminal domain-containing protein [Saprospiraceae bacterium]|nr:gliding motility-associated C-terminal domain-containing protein [Saprospiraceae bacterium]
MPFSALLSRYITRSSVLFFLLLSVVRLSGQSSFFTFDNEDWTCNADAESINAYWSPTGGNTGGHIWMNDESTGGTWGFVAPAKFHGNLMGAYGCYLSYDIRTDNNTNPNSTYHVELRGGNNIKLVYNNSILPQNNWTHFDIKLKEDAGWRIGTLNGAVPTAAQFQSVLSNVTYFWIRGEFYSQGEDQGGLDRVTFFGQFDIDLDGDNSSGESNGNFRIDSTCFGLGKICDSDAILWSETTIGRIEIFVQNAANSDTMVINGNFPNLSITHPEPHKIVLTNTGNASAFDFLQAIQAIEYQDIAIKPRSGIRTIEVVLYNECEGKVASRFAYLPIFPPRLAGNNADTTVCPYSDEFFARDLLYLSDAGGYWRPEFSGGGNFFNPQEDPAGVYAYIIPVGRECEGDTSFLTVAIEQPFDLGVDSTLCNGEIYSVPLPSGISIQRWKWSDGSSKTTLNIQEPGIYGLEIETQNCTFADSLEARYWSCDECPAYAPNVFSPNDDGKNDGWRLYHTCFPDNYQLEVYDRWGSLVFITNDPEKNWYGFARSRNADAGVFGWQARWTAEYYGKPREYYMKGDVTLVR